jgi:hypothetical protein
VEAANGDNDPSDAIRGGEDEGKNGDKGGKSADDDAASHSSDGSDDDDDGSAGYAGMEGSGGEAGDTDDKALHNDDDDDDDDGGGDDKGEEDGDDNGDIDDNDDDDDDDDNDGCGARRGVGMTDSESLRVQPSLPAAVHIQRSQPAGSDAADDVTVITASDSADNMVARAELCEVLDNMIAEQLDRQEGSSEADGACARRKGSPHVEVPGRGMVSKHTLVLELNRMKSVGKHGDALAKLDTSRLRRVQQASRDGADKTARETVDALVSCGELTSDLESVW